MLRVETTVKENIIVVRYKAVYAHLNLYVMLKYTNNKPNILIYASIN